MPTSPKTSPSPSFASSTSSPGSRRVYDADFATHQNIELIRDFTLLDDHIACIVEQGVQLLGGVGEGCSFHTRENLWEPVIIAPCALTRAPANRAKFAALQGAKDPERFFHIPANIDIIDSDVANDAVWIDDVGASEG